MCDICLHNPCIVGCPNYSPIPSELYCEICDEWIYPGEEYIENYTGEHIHLGCISSSNATWLMGWLGHTIKIMDI